MEMDCGWIVDYKLPMCHILFLAASICFSQCPQEAFKIDEGFPVFSLNTYIHDVYVYVYDVYVPFECTYS